MNGRRAFPELCGLLNTHTSSFPTAQPHLSGGDDVQDGETLDVYET